MTQVRVITTIGPRSIDPEVLKKLKEAGATQFNIYLDSGDEEEIIAHYGNKVIPAFR